VCYYIAAMPITVGAIRKQRADGRKAARNSQIRESLRETVSLMRKKPTAKQLVQVFKKADRAAKSGIIHANKAKRLKSRLSALVKSK